MTDSKPGTAKAVKSRGVELNNVVPDEVAIWSVLKELSDFLIGARNNLFFCNNVLGDHDPHYGGV